MKKLLDAFACEGGATAGYQRAGWHVTSVDTDRNRLRYNPAAETVVADAIDYIREHGHKFAAIHASPPCQRYTRGNAYRDTSAYPDLIGPTREALLATGKPYVLENVPDAKAYLRDPVVLCGTMFGLVATDDDGTLLHLRRHRLFETNWPLVGGDCNHALTAQVAGAYGGARRDKNEARHVRKGGYVPAADVLRKLLDVPWMTQRGIFECLPPAYTEHIGRALLEASW